jgi:hypothetical protein
MKYHIIYILTLFVLLCSCSDRKIPQEKLPQIIAELHLADKYANEILGMQEALFLDSVKIYEPVFNKYGYTSEDYKKTIDRYISRPKKLRTYFESAKSILEEQKIAIQAKVAEHMKMDSIIGVYTRILDSNNSKYAYYKEVQANKWIYLPHSDNRWPLQNAPTDITLSVEYEPFKVISPEVSNTLSPLWANSYMPATTDNKNNTDIRDNTDNQNISNIDNEETSLSSESDDYSGDVPNDNASIRHNEIFVRFNKVKYPIWFFSSQKMNDTLRLGSSINRRVLFPNLIR